MKAIQATRRPLEALATLEELRRHSGGSEAKILRALIVLSRSRIGDAGSLIRLHEALLFLRAYPPSARVRRRIDAMLGAFSARVAALRDAGEDLSPLDAVEVSGVAGTRVTSNFSHAIVRWLVAKHPGRVSIDWDWFEEEERFGATMPRFLPLLEEDALVEAHVPYRAWLQAARGRRNELVWLIGRFDALEMPEAAKAELYDSLKLHVTWAFPLTASRTGMTRSTRKRFFHPGPLIQRRDTSLAKELASPPIPVERCSRVAGERILELARATSAVRYRELHGFTHGDSRSVLRADLGRGTEAFVFGVPPDHRLPLRAYHAALIFKNGVPVGYFEGLSIFERLESGFNLYYTFREGETAWLFGRILRLMRQLLGVTVFSIDPYQVGHENEEGIESGAFWFYRKLGFRPVRPSLMRLALAEEQRLATRSDYRTPARTLRRLADGPMVFGTPKPGDRDPGHGWDRFEVRNIGLAVQRRTALEFGGDAQAIRADSSEFIARVLDIDTRRWDAPARKLFEGLAMVLAMIPAITRWSAVEKRLAARIIHAKARGEEARYLRLMQKHARLRAALMEFGSRQVGRR